MSSQKLPFPNIPTILFGGITYPINPEPLDRANMLQNQKANSYSQPALPVNTKAAQKHAGSQKSSSPKVQHNLLPLNTKQVPPDSECWTAVSHWLATSQTFEKPPRPAPIADPAPREISCKEYWLQVAQSLEFRIKSREEKSKASIHLKPGSVNANSGINSSISIPQSQTKLPESDEHTPPGQLDIVFPFLSNTMSPPEKQERERKDSIEANIFEIKEKLEKHKGEQAQLESVKLDQSDEVVQAKAKGLEAAKSKKTDESVRGKEKGEQLEAAKSKKEDEAVKARARKLAADAMERHKKQQERKKYVEGRAQDIHVNLLHSKPFDIDAVRREFSEKEVQDIKKIVRELGFEKTL